MQEYAGRLIRTLCVLTGSQISDLNHNLHVDRDHSIASAEPLKPKPGQPTLRTTGRTT